MSEPRLAHLWFVFWDEPDLTRTTLLGASIAAAILTLAIVSARIGYGSLPGDYYGVWLFFSVVIGYTVATGSYLLPKTIEDLNALQPIITVSDADFERLRHGVAHHPIRAQRLQTAIGLVAGIIHDTILGGMFRSFLSWEAPAELTYFSSVCTIAVWTLMFQLAGALIRNAVVFSRLGRTHVRISIFDRRPLAAFGRTALRPALLLVGIQVALPLLWIQSSFQYAQAVPGFVATVLVIFATFLLPLIGVHRRLLGTRREAIDNVTSAIGSMEHILERPDALIADDERSRFTELVTLKREIEASTSWPIDVPVMRHLSVYLILPPLTWVGAALIENAVDAML